MMKQRAPTKAEAKYMNQCKDLGCIVCILMGYIKPYEVAPEHTSVHHIDGKTKEGAHFKSIPLCAEHHQLGRTARHVNKNVFEGLYGKEDYLLKRTMEFLDAVK